MLKNEFINYISKISEGRCHGKCLIEESKKYIVVDRMDVKVFESGRCLNVFMRKKWK